VARTVVIVDDYGAFRAAARRLLEAGGYRVVGEAQDGASALEAVVRLLPDVVLLDVLLPDTNGFDVAARLAERADSRIVMVSSRDARAYRGQLSGSPACGFVNKGDLSLRSLDSLLDRRP
jgi:two-component system chemotaxis response regulator CheY